MSMLLQSIVSDAVEHTAEAADELSHSLALSMARTAAIPHGQILSNDEMEQIVNELFACSKVNYTLTANPSFPSSRRPISSAFLPERVKSC